MSSARGQGNGQLHPDLTREIQNLLIFKSLKPTWTASTRTRCHLVVAVQLSALILGYLGGLQFLLSFLCLGHLLLVLVKGLKVARDDGDGEGEDQHPGHRAEGPHQLTQAWGHQIVHHIMLQDMI